MQRFHLFNVHVLHLTFFPVSTTDTMISALFRSTHSLLFRSLYPPESIFLLLLFSIFFCSEHNRAVCRQIAEKESTGNNHNWNEHRQEVPRNAMNMNSESNDSRIEVDAQWLGKSKTMKLHTIFIRNVQCHGACLWRRFRGTFFFVWCLHTAAASMREMSKSLLAPNYNNYTVYMRRYSSGLFD